VQYVRCANSSLNKERLQEATDSEGGASIDEAVEVANRDQSALSDGFNPGYVKRGMDTHGSGELELHHHQVDDLLDLKRTKGPVSWTPPGGQGHGLRAKHSE